VRPSRRLKMGGGGGCSEEAGEEEAPLARHRAQGGRIKCVQPDCDAMYAEPALARILPDESFRECRAAQDAPESCFDLQAQHGDLLPRGRGRISNACPSCGFFSRERGDWVRWVITGTVTCGRRAHLTEWKRVVEQEGR